MFRKCDIELIDSYASKYNLCPQAISDLYNLCLNIHSSGWVDGSNDIIYDEEE